MRVQALALALLWPAVAGAATATVKVKVAVVRAAPDGEAVIIGTVAESEQVEVTDTPAKGWRVIHLSDGTSGFIRDSQISDGAAGADSAAGAHSAAARDLADTAVRGTMRVNGLSLSGIGIEVSRRLIGVVGVDAALTAENFGVNWLGAGGEALVRLFGGPGRHSPTVGVGAALRSAPQFGAIGFAVGEVAYEYRPVRGLSVLIGSGVELVLNQSGMATCREPTCGLFLRTHYASGEFLIRFRLAIGGSF